MPTISELKIMARNLKIKGRSKMNKAQLEAALGVKPTVSRKVKVKKSRKPRVKKSRKPRVKKSRKPRVKKSRKPRVKKSRKPRVKKSRKPRVKKKSRKAVKVHKSGKHTRYEDIISAYVNGDASVEMMYYMVSLFTVLNLEK